jgi:hypothetical protein
MGSAGKKIVHLGAVAASGGRGVSRALQQRQLPPRRAGAHSSEACFHSETETRGWKKIHTHTQKQSSTTTKGGRKLPKNNNKESSKRKLGNSEKLVTIYNNKDCKSVVFLFRIEYTAKTTKAALLQQQQKHNNSRKLWERERNGEKEPNPTVVPTTSIECRPVSCCLLQKKEEDSKYVLHSPRRSSSCMHACMQDSRAAKKLF